MVVLAFLSDRVIKHKYAIKMYLVFLRSIEHQSLNRLEDENVQVCEFKKVI